MPSSWRTAAPAPAMLNTIERIVGVFGRPDNARLLIFSLMIGALLAFIRVSGGVAALVESLVKRGIARSPRSTALLTSGVGCAATCSRAAPAVW